jgi:hypothetical protein
MTDVPSRDSPERPPFQLDIGRIGIFVALPVICWAFYTTSSGMVDIMRRGPEDMIGPIGAVIGSAAVLAMLALTSWSLGTDLAAILTRQPGVKGPNLSKVLIIALVFSFVFSISAFFSFTYYYNNIFGLSSKQITNEEQPLEIAREILIPLQKAIKATYDAETKRIVEDSGTQSYVKSLDGIWRAAGAGGANFQDAVRTASADAAKEAETRRKEAQQARHDLDQAQATIAKLDRDVTDLDKLIKPKQEENGDLEAKANAEDQLAIDASKGLDNMGAKCGPNCRQHQAEAAKIRGRMKTIDETLIPLLQSRADKVARRNGLAAQLPTVQEKLQSAQASEKAALKVGASDALNDPGATLRELATGRDRVRLDPTWEHVNETKTPCNIVLKIERQLKMVPSEVPADFACEPFGEAREMLTARDKVIAGRKEFEQKCSLDGEIGKSISAISDRIRGDRSGTIDGLSEAKKLVDACIVAARATGLAETDVQKFLKQSDDFVRDNTLEQNRFARAMKAFWQRTPDTNMAIGVAVAQDAFILILKLLSEIFGREVRRVRRPETEIPINIADDDRDPAEIRAVKALLRHAQPGRNDTSELVLDAPAVASGLTPEVHENLRALVKGLVRQQKAHIDRKGNYVIENTTIYELEDKLRVSPAVAAKGADFGPAQTSPVSRRNERTEPVVPQEVPAASETKMDPEHPAAPSRRRRPSALAQQYLSGWDESAGSGEAGDAAQKPSDGDDLPTRDRNVRPAEGRGDGESDMTLSSLRARRRSGRDS